MESEQRRRGGVLSLFLGKILILNISFVIGWREHAPYLEARSDW